MSREDWGRIIFSDECYVYLGDKQGCVYVTRRADEELLDECLVPTVTHLQAVFGPSYDMGMHCGRGEGPTGCARVPGRQRRQNELNSLPKPSSRFGSDTFLHSNEAPEGKYSVSTGWRSQPPQ
jgi:hypothetical protein